VDRAQAQVDCRWLLTLIVALQSRRSECARIPADNNDLGSLGFSQDSEGGMERWEQLPEWVRWVLSGPLALAGSIAAGFTALYLARTALDRFFIPDAVLTAVPQILQGSTVGFTSILLVFSLVPGWKTAIAAIMLILPITLVLVSVFDWYLISSGKLSYDDQSIWDTINSILCLAASTAAFRIGLRTKVRSRAA